jgi:hypothetical protein
MAEQLPQLGHTPVASGNAGRLRGRTRCNCGEEGEAQGSARAAPCRSRTSPDRNGLARAPLALRGELDVAGLSWTSLDMIHNARRADQRT